MGLDLDYTAYPYQHEDCKTHILCSRLSADGLNGKTDIPEIVIRNFNIMGPVFWSKFLEFEVKCKGTNTSGALVFLSTCGHLWAGVLRFDLTFAAMHYFRKTFLPLEEHYLEMHASFELLPHKAFLHEQLLKPKSDDYLTLLELKQINARQLGTLEFQLGVVVNTVKVHIPLVTSPEIILFTWP